MLNLRPIRHRLTKTAFKVPLNWMQHVGLRPDDVFLASYPKSGMSWFRFLLYESVAGDSVGFKELNVRVPSVGRHFGAPKVLPDHRRLIQTHEPFRPVYRSAVYLVRDPRDVAISEYHYLRMLRFIPAEETLEVFLERFVCGSVNRYGSWHSHVGGWLEASSEQERKICVVRFEDLKVDPALELRKVFEFLGMDISPSQLDRAVKNNSLGRMRDKDQAARSDAHRHHVSRGNFVRSGVAGGWRNALEPKQASLFTTPEFSVMKSLGYAW